jgi:hypothetical protein
VCLKNSDCGTRGGLSLSGGDVGSTLEEDEQTDPSETLTQADFFRPVSFKHQRQHVGIRHEREARCHRSRNGVLSEHEGSLAGLLIWTRREYAAALGSSRVVAPR